MEAHNLGSGRDTRTAETGEKKGEERGFFSQKPFQNFTKPKAKGKT